MLIDIIPTWLLFFLVVGIVLLSGEIGFRVGRKVRRKAEDERESPVSTMAGVVLGLLSFMLAFTFDVFDAQAHALHQAQPRAVGQGTHQPHLPAQVASDGPDLLPGEDHGQALVFPRPLYAIDPFDGLAEHLAVEEELGRERLVLCGRGDLVADG